MLDALTSLHPLRPAIAGLAALWLLASIDESGLRLSRQPAGCDTEARRAHA